MKVCGIDPGQSGGLAILDTSAWSLSSIPTPTFSITKTTKTKSGKFGKRTEYDIQAIRSFIYGQDIAHAWIELVGVMPKEGAVSAFNFGKGYGILLGLIAGLQISEYRVRPAVWKKHFGLTADKDASRMKASQVAPQCAGIWRRASLDGPAEAFLIALYGAATLGRTPDRGIIPAPGFEVAQPASLPPAADPSEAVNEPDNLEAMLANLKTARVRGPGIQIKIS